MVASSSTDYQGPMPINIDRVQDAKGEGKKGKDDHQKGKGKDAKGKGKKGKGDQKGKEGDQKGQGKGKDQKGKGVATCYTCGKPGHLAREVASDPAHSSSGGASVTTHTVGQQQQQAIVSQQSSSADAKPVVRRIESSETIIDLRERDEEVDG